MPRTLTRDETETLRRLAENIRKVTRRHPDRGAHDAYTTYAEYDETYNIEAEELANYVCGLFPEED